MGDEKRPTFSAITGCDLQNFVLPKKWSSRSGAGCGATSVLESPMPQHAVEKYAELHAWSNYSFLQGGSHPEELVAQAAALGLSGLGITDRNSLAGVVRAHVFARENPNSVGAMRVCNEDRSTGRING